MGLDILLRRILLYRLMRYRLVWLACGMFCFYLALSVGLTVRARYQTQLTGTLNTCALDQTADPPQVAFSLHEHMGLTFRFAPQAFSPEVPASICSARRVKVVIETDPLQGPVAVDRLEVTSAATPQRTTTYVSAAGRDFSLAKRLTLVTWSGGLGVLGLLMTLVATFWRHTGALVHRGRQENRHVPQAALTASKQRQLADDLRWMLSLPWGARAFDPATDRARFERGLALVRGWTGDDERLMAGAAELVGCSPGLAYTGAAEVALQFAQIGPTAWSPEGARAALLYAERALGESQDLNDAKIARAHALAALGACGDDAALFRAKTALRDLAAKAPRHPRLATAVAAVYLAHRQYDEAAGALRNALCQAPSQAEADAIHQQLVWLASRHGDLGDTLRAMVRLQTARCPVPATTSLAPSVERASATPESVMTPASPIPTQSAVS